VSKLYILDEAHNAIEVSSETFSLWHADEDKTLVKREHHGDYFISTRFFGTELGLTLGTKLRPLLFETMAFLHHGTPKMKILMQERCCTWDEAVKQHERIAAVFRKRIKEKENCPIV
jgi:hypothetical protein